MEALCRLCMNFGSAGMEPIFRSVMANCIASKIAGITQLTLFEGDGLPSNVCQQCIFKLNVADSFIQMCTISDKALRALQAVQNATALAKDSDSSNGSNATNQSVDAVSSNAHQGTSDLQSGPSKELQKCNNQQKYDYEDLTKTGIDTVQSGNFKYDVDDLAEEVEESKHVNQSLGHTFSKDATISTTKKMEDLSASSSPFNKDNYIDGSATEVGKESGKAIVKEPTEFHKCVACNQKFSSKYNLARHAKLHTENTHRSIFKAAKLKQSCNNTETNLAARQSLKSNEVGGRENTCRICCKTFDSQLKLARHACHSKKTRVFSCDICPKTFTQRHNLKKYKLKHLECSICHKTYKSEKTLRNHLVVHSRKRPFSCPQCDKCFTQRTNFIRHMAIHSDIRPYECAECGAKFKRGEHLKRHLKSHEINRPRGINNCFKRKSSNCTENSSLVLRQPLDEHFLLGSQNPTPEDIVGDLITCKDSVQSHDESPNLDEKVVCEKLITCKVCGQSFSERPDFDSHLETHTAIGEDLFSCEICGRQFFSEASVAQHIRIHDRIARLKCSKCTQFFKTTLGLQEHIKCHENDSQFICSVCSESFTCKEGLQFHSITHFK